MCFSQELGSPQRPGPPPDFPPPPPSAVADADSAAPFLGITLPTPNDENGGALPAMESLQGMYLVSALFMFLYQSKSCVPDLCCIFLCLFFSKLDLCQIIYFDFFYLF